MQDDDRWMDVEVIDLDPPAPPARGQRSGFLFAGFLTVLVTLIAVTGFSPGRDTTAPGNESPDPRASGAPADAPTPRVTNPLATPGASTWTAVDLRGFGRGAGVENLWALGDRFFAEIESDEGPDGGPYGPVSSVLVSSENGLEWDRVELPVSEFVVEAGTVEAGRLWILGYVGHSGDAPLQIWSTDGGTWRHESDPLGLAAPPERVTAVAYRSACEADGACVGVGWVAVVGGPSGGDRLVVSADGRTWASVELSVELGLSVVGITFHRGRWVAAAAGLAASGHPVILVLTSHDRRRWSSQVVAASADDGSDIASGATGLAIVGMEPVQGSRLPRAWLSADGEMWRSVSGETLAGRAPAPMDHVTATARGYFSMNRSSGDAWLSTDGRTWRNVIAFVPSAGDQVRAIASAGDLLLGAGRTSAGRPVFWVGSRSIEVG